MTSIDLEHRYKTLPLFWTPQYGLIYPMKLYLKNGSHVIVSSYGEHHAIIRKLFKHG